MVDDHNHVITSACADFADQRESQCLEQIVELTKENLKGNQIELGQILADGGYSSGEAFGKNQYRSSESDCKNCPLCQECCGKVTKYKKLDDSIHKELYDKMHQKLTQNPNMPRVW